MQKVLSHLKWNESGIMAKFGDKALTQANQIDKAFKELRGDFIGRPPKYSVYILDIDGIVKTVYTNFVRECPTFHPLDDSYNKINDYLDDNGYWGQICPFEILKYAIKD